MVAGAVVVGLANVLTATLAGGVTAPLAIPVLGLLVAAYQRFIQIGTNLVPVAQVVSTGQTVGTAYGTIKVVDPNGDPFAVTIDQGPSKGIVTLLPDLIDTSKYTYTYTWLAGMWSLFSTAASASTMASDDISSTNVDCDVTGMLRIAFRCVAHCGGSQASCGNGPTTLRPL